MIFEQKDSLFFLKDKDFRGTDCQPGAKMPVSKSAEELTTKDSILLDSLSPHLHQKRNKYDNLKIVCDLFHLNIKNKAINQKAIMRRTGAL